MNHIKRNIAMNGGGAEKMKNTFTSYLNEDEVGHCDGIPGTEWHFAQSPDCF